MQHIRDGWPNSEELPTTIKSFWNEKASLHIVDNMLLLQREDNSRVVVPEQLRNDILDLLHTSHWGVTRMKELARRHVWWPKIGEDIEKVAQACDTCRVSASKPPSTYTSWPKPKGPWQRLHIDFAGPFQSKMWLVCIDSYSKYPYIGVTDIGKTTTQDTIAMLQDIFTTEGLPMTIVSDNGPQFNSNEFNSFCQKNGIEHITTPPYNPESNGEAERFVRTMKTALTKKLINRQ